MSVADEAGQSIRGVDLLQSLPEVNAQRIGAHGLRNRVRSAFLLDAPEQKRKYEQSYDSGLGLREVRVQLSPKPPDSMLPVLALEIDGVPDVEAGILQQGDGSVTLPAFAAEIHSRQSEKPISISRMGTTEGWTDERGSLSWDFTVYRPGRFVVKVLTSSNRALPWRGGHQVTVAVGGAELSTMLAKDEEIKTITTRYYPQVASRCGEVVIKKAGKQRLTLRADKIAHVADGLTVAMVTLSRIAEE